MGVKEMFRENMLLEVYDPRDNIYYKSIIQEVNESYLAIGVPLRRQKQLFMPEDSVWDFRLSSRDTLLYFSSRCLGLKKSGNVSLYIISWPDEVKRVQRREYYRFPCSFDAHYWILKKPWEEKEQLQAEGEQEKATGEEAPARGQLEEEAENAAGEPLRKEKKVEVSSLEKLAKQLGKPGKAMIADLSGGGAQLVAPHWLPIGTVLLLALFLESKKKKKTLFVKGKVVWVGPYQPERTVHFRHAVEFIDAPERLREEIVGFIFILMRERMI